MSRIGKFIRNAMESLSPRSSFSNRSSEESFVMAIDASNISSNPLEEPCHRYQIEEPTREHLDALREMVRSHGGDFSNSIRTRSCRPGRSGGYDSDGD